LAIWPDGDPSVADGGNADARSSNSILGTGWHQVAYTYSGVPNVNNNGVLYVDGAPAASNTVGSVAGDTLDAWIGGSPDYGTARLFPGSLAHAALFAHALSAAQVAALYDASLAAPPVKLSIAVSGAETVTLTWPQGALLQSTNAAGPWATNTAASPCTVVPSNSQMYFKVRVN
jgi:hypothetical protein